MNEEFLLLALYLRKDDETPYWNEQRGNLFGWMLNCYGILEKELSSNTENEAFMIVLFKNWIIILENSRNIEKIAPEYLK